MSHNIAQNVCQVQYGFSFRSLKFYKCCFSNYCSLDLSRQNPVVEPPHHSLSESSKESSKTTTGDETPIDAKRYPNDTKQP